MKNTIIILAFVLAMLYGCCKSADEFPAGNLSLDNQSAQNLTHQNASAGNPGSILYSSNGSFLIAADPAATAISKMNLTDTNNDGKIDYISMDSDGDGVMDTFLFDTNFDGKIDKWHVFFRGKDSYAWDMTGDGIPDVYDSDGDGTPDAWDVNSDGIIDERDPNNDGVIELHDADFNGVFDEIEALTKK